jgi:hypothetical protein
MQYCMYRIYVERSSQKVIVVVCCKRWWNHLDRFVSQDIVSVSYLYGLLLYTTQYCTLVKKKTNSVLTRKK